MLAAAVGANDQGQSGRVKKAPTCAEATEHLRIVGVLQFKCGTSIPNLPWKYAASISSLDVVALKETIIV